MKVTFKVPGGTMTGVVIKTHNNEWGESYDIQAADGELYQLASDQVKKK